MGLTWRATRRYTQQSCRQCSQCQGPLWPGHHGIHAGETGRQRTCDPPLSCSTPIALATTAAGKDPSLLELLAGSICIPRLPISNRLRRCRPNKQNPLQVPAQRRAPFVICSATRQSTSTALLMTRPRRWLRAFLFAKCNSNTISPNTIHL